MLALCGMSRPSIFPSVLGLRVLDSVRPSLSTIAIYRESLWMSIP